MGINNIGENISRLRKEKNVTQETLANHVGVSTQAVSKWENGGVPDIELLPSIADFFNVSIDNLFGREIINDSDIYSAIAKKLEITSREDKFKIAFDILWAIQLIYGECEIVPIDEVNPAYSQINWDAGLSLFNIQKQSRYAFFMPKSDLRSEWLLDGIDYTSFFKMLSEKDTLDSLILLYKNPSLSFTADFLVKSLNLSIERSCEIIESFVKFDLLDITEVDINDEIMYVYKLHNNPKFVILLTFAREIIKSPNSYYIYIGGQDKRYL